MKFENVYKESEENMRLALLSLWTPGSHPMRTAIDELITEEPLLAEPVFQSTFGWEPAVDDSWKKYLNPSVIQKLGIGEKYPPYKHQAESWEQLSLGKSIVVTSGTGSGKTECFMYPVISDLYEQGHNNAIEAIFLYPLNALMEDQKKRLSEYCKATGLHFAVYNGDTAEYHADGGNDILPNEVATREEIRDSKHLGTRPEILLTNPSMLEYILVRQKDQQMLQESAGKLRWIIIDEAHSYSGSAAVELAYQIKRILDAFDCKAGNVRFACTSATIGGSEGKQSLADFIAKITSQPIKQITIVDGKRLVRPLDKEKLAAELKANNLPSVERVLSLRDKINTVPGMTLQQIWEWLRPDCSYSKQQMLPALRLLDQLCEMSQDKNPILSIRAHFFMRSISGIYACANPQCDGKNSSEPLYGHLTTNKATVCPDCGAPLLELVQCKRCGGFVLMGDSDSNTHQISPCNDVYNNDDYFSIDLSPEDEDNDEKYELVGNPHTFFLMPYNKKTFFNPVSKANYETSDIVRLSEGEILKVSAENEGKWVDVRKEDGHLYCPSCGRLAKGKRLNLKHFRIPINFINQTISPVLLQESAPDKNCWGKYIAFTDSRQGTAISAKTFNINVERILSRENMIKELVAGTKQDIPAEALAVIPEQLRAQFLSQLSNSAQSGLSLEKISDCLFDRHLFEHIAGKNNENDKKAYKVALMRQIIGRKPLFESSTEGMGIISLAYPGLKTIKCPASLIDYIDTFGGSISDKDWQDFLKISLDFVFRVGNHIQPLIDISERKYVRDANISTPITGPDDDRIGISQWPSVIEDNEGVLKKQHRLVLLLCAGLGINSQSELQERKKYISNIIKDAWQNLVDKKILTKVTSGNYGYNDSYYHRNNEYVGCYYLDLSGENGNDVCKVELAKELKECPVTGQLLDTTFCGYSPMMTGEISEQLFAKYKCSDQIIKMPQRPKDDDEVDHWEQTNEGIKNLKEKGFWSDRHKYAYQKRPVYIAAEHSAQQSKKLLREYTKAFSQKNPSINVLHCSTTMEMGVDIGDIDVVLMDTIPPTAANYLQRVGRAGRMGQSKAIAFSLCNNTPVGQHAFDNPMWALNTPNRMIPVRESKTIIQRHINSFFFRQFICNNGSGIQATMTIDEFMSSTCDSFVQFLDDMSTNTVEQEKFKKVFGNSNEYTINLTKDCIVKIQTDYNGIMKELKDAYDKYEKEDRRRIAIRIQIRKLQDESLLKYLSEHQFIPNANMPTGVVTFDFADKDQSDWIADLDKKAKELQNKISIESDSVKKANLQSELDNIRKRISDIHQATTATRDIHTALNEYAPEQTVVVNEKNYISAGIKLVGEYKDETQTRAIYHCSHCGHTEYGKILEENTTCPICKNPYRGIIDKDNSHFTLAYEPVGFRTDQNVYGSREEKTDKQYYDIRPVLLNTNLGIHTDINMCEIIGSQENDNILFYNVGRGYGFAFCKRCGRAAVEHISAKTKNDIKTLPNAVKPGHQCLWGSQCEANINDIARNVVFTGMHPTCYTVLRFKKGIGSAEYENDQQLAYSLGVVLKRALAKSEGIDETEIDFGIKQEKDTWILFIYDTAKGGCGYSLKMKNPVLCQQVIDLARQELEETTCTCHIDGGACSKCLVDRNNYRDANLLSKAKALDWLNKQKDKAIEIPNEVKKISPSAKVVYQSLKEILKQSIKDIEVKQITLCVSDLSDDIVVTDWSRIRSEMGKYISTAVSNGKKIKLVVEYHAEYHGSLSEQLPFINLNEKLPECDVQFVKDMGALKTAIIVESTGKTIRYFTDKGDSLSFSNNWGKNCSHVFADSQNVEFVYQKQPTFAMSPSQVVREGTTNVSMFNVKNYYSKAIQPSVLQEGDFELLTEILKGERVVITFSDMYVNSALASLMLVYLIEEMKTIFNFSIDQIILQLDSHKRKCNNDYFNGYTTIDRNFPNKEDADNYTDSLFQNILEIIPEHSSTDADHHRWLRIETQSGGCVEIRPDHGISGGYQTDSKYMNLHSLNGNVSVVRKNEDVLYYIIIKKVDK